MDRVDKVASIVSVLKLRVTESVSLSVDGTGGYTNAVHDVYISSLHGDISDVIENLKERLEHLAVCLATDTAPLPISQHPTEERAIERVKSGFIDLREARYCVPSPPPLLPMDDIVRFASFIHLLNRLVVEVHAVHDSVAEITKKKIDNFV